MQRIIKSIGGVVLVCTTTCVCVRAQDDCEKMLAQSGVNYNLGRFVETINVITSHERCLQGSDLPDSLKVQAYKFLAVSFIVLDYPDRAVDPVEKLLMIDPEYIPDAAENLPRVFKQMVADTSRRVQAYKKRALVFIDNGEIDSATHAILMMFQLRPYFQADESDPARFKEIVADRRTRVRAYKNRTLVQLARGDTAAAKETVVLIYMTDPAFQPGPDDRLLFARTDLIVEARRRQAIAWIDSSRGSEPEDSLRFHDRAEKSIAALLRVDPSYSATGQDPALYRELVDREREGLSVTGSFPWLWVGGGVVVASGIVAAFLLNKSEEPPKPLPLPPVFPSP